MDKQAIIDRNQFLKKFGMSTAAMLAIHGLGSCINEKEGVRPPAKVDFSLDLTQQLYAVLKTSGGFIIQNSIVVARTGQGTYAAVTQVCSHLNLQQITFQNGEFLCTAHYARYDTTGKGLNTQAANGLTTYKTQLNGDVLRIYE